MTKTSAHALTPRSPRVERDSTKPDGSKKSNMFSIGLAINMAWQLAIVSLLPVIGGAMLDSNFETAPWFTLTGLVLASAGSVVVVWRTLKTMSEEDADV